MHIQQELTALDRRTHGPCPNKPEGYKWWAHNHSRFGSVGWGFNTFTEALAYCRDGWERSVNDTKVRRPKFRCWIEGPYGEFDRADTYQLVTGRKW